MKVALTNSGVVPSERLTATADWAALTKRTIARFARGSIAAQRERVLLFDERASQHERACAIAAAWKKRALAG